MRLAEHHEKISDVFALYGIKPKIEKTKGNHVRFKWSVGNKPQVIITSSTPSDWRTADNEIARVRRKLKAAGVGKIAPIKTAKPAAQPVPAPAVPNTELEARVAQLEQRNAQLERDMMLLLDRLTDPTYQAFAGVPDNVKQLAAEIQVTAKKLATALAKPPKQKRVAGGKRANDKAAWLWPLLRYDEFTPLADILKASSGRTLGSVSVALSAWKKRGYVEHRPRVGWRKTPKVEELSAPQKAAA